MALMDTLQDKFETGLDLVTKWGLSTSGVTWSSTSKRARVDCTKPDSYLLSGTTYDLTGSYIYACLYKPGVGTGTREMALGAGNGNNFHEFKVTANAMTGNKSVAGVLTTQSLGTYTLPGDRWWRIRESGGNVIYETSPNGTIWTSRWTTAKGIDVTAIYGYVRCGYQGTETVDECFVDFVNMPMDVLPKTISSPNIASMIASTR